MNALSRMALCLVCMYALSICCFGQPQAPQFVQAFASLGQSNIDAVSMITEPGTPPMLVVLAARSSNEEIYLFSLSNKQSRVVWHLSPLPPSVEVINPINLKIEYTEAGPLITLHGCARHLCGGEGSAGAFTYSVATGKMCSALASWDSRTKRANIDYSCPGGKLTDLEKSLLDKMMKEEHY